MKNKISALVILVLLSVLLGYFRNSFFINLNTQTSCTYYHMQAPALPWFLNFLANKDYKSLILLKWFFTIFFSIIFCLLATGGLYIIYKERFYIQLCLALYGLLFAMAFIFMLSGYLFRLFSEHAYSLARSLMHIGQSPFALLLVITVIYYHRHITAKSK
jgi:hypothetical protein